MLSVINIQVRVVRLPLSIYLSPVRQGFHQVARQAQQESSIPGDSSRKHIAPGVGASGFD
ncbi:MAG: hypothetical protein BGO09_01730 [Bacteroidetes bacterium 47-18]|nr:MAG: hypothetical protein BGO09_01730 [Bacteroidetes bacterium 47-18]